MSAYVKLIVSISYTGLILINLYLRIAKSSNFYGSFAKMKNYAGTFYFRSLLILLRRVK